MNKKDTESMPDAGDVLPYPPGFIESITSFDGMRKLKNYLKSVVDLYGCQNCGMCCMTDAPLLSSSEIKIISKMKRLDEKKFLGEYCMMRPLPIVEKRTRVRSWINGFVLKTPCPFRIYKKCKIYQIRPSICRMFPFIIRFDSIGKFEGVFLEFIFVCPIATLISEEYWSFLERKTGKTFRAFYGEADENQKIINEGRKKLGLPELCGTASEINIFVLQMVLEEKFKGSKKEGIKL